MAVVHAFASISTHYFHAKQPHVDGLKSTISFPSSIGPRGWSRSSAITCSSSNGRVPDSEDDGVKSVERLLEEKRRAELSVRIASVEFTMQQSGGSSSRISRERIIEKSLFHTASFQLKAKQSEKRKTMV